MKTNKKLLSTIPYLKTLIPTLLTILLLIIGIFVIVIPQFEKIIMDRKREMIRELTNSATGIIDNWYKLYKEGNISEEEAKNSSVMFIQNLRYGEELKDYFWITNSVPEMIVHPYRPDLNRKNLKDFKDSHGKKLFVEMAKKVEQQGEGYVDYMWQWKDDSTRIVPKLSYVKAFAPWNWVIGTGIYIEDVKLEMAALERNIITLSFIITALSSILLIYIAVQNLKSELKRKNAEDELKESREKYRMLVEASGEGLIMILENGQVFFNKTLHKMLE
ncbi:MAG: hypothetical protein GYA14_08230, partial [Ignavibacteria bacterium]|nr:hypothetical protein [Ignavibacteria bacterium]